MMILQKRTFLVFCYIQCAKGIQPTKSINIWKFYADDGNDEAFTTNQQNRWWRLKNHILVLYAYRHPTIFYFLLLLEIFNCRYARLNLLGSFLLAFWGLVGLLILSAFEDILLLNFVRYSKEFECRYKVYHLKWCNLDYILVMVQNVFDIQFRFLLYLNQHFWEAKKIFIFANAWLKNFSNELWLGFTVYTVKSVLHIGLDRRKNIFRKIEYHFTPNLSKHDSKSSKNRECVVVVKCKKRSIKKLREF